MKLKINKSTAHGTVSAIGSKSYAHRYIIASLLSDGISYINNVPECDDVRATFRAVSSFGADVTHNNGNLIIKSHGFFPDEKTVIDCAESGSTLRFLIPLALTSGKTITFAGGNKLLSRPLGYYEKLCSENGFLFDKKDVKVTVCGKMSGGRFTVPGNISSQYITGLMFSLPLLNKNSVIEIIPPVESYPYIQMTKLALDTFGIKTEFDGNDIFISGNQHYTPANVTVEGDWSSAANILAFNYVGGDVNVDGLVENSVQGDRIFVQYAEKLTKSDCTIDIMNCPDLAPILFVLAAVNNGATFVNTGRLKYKESDRANAMKSELGKLGVDIEVHENSVVVHKSILITPKAVISSHNDHRIAMAMSAALTITGGLIDGVECVEKSYPSFFNDLIKIGISCREADD